MFKLKFNKSKRLMSSFTSEIGDCFKREGELGDL